MTGVQFGLPELLESLRSADGGQLINQLTGWALQALVDLEAAGVIGAGRHERTAARTTQRNGTRAKRLSTAAGEVTVAIPKLRAGSFFPALLEPRRRIDRALHAVICEAWVHGVSTRKVDDLVLAMGNVSGVSKSEVSRICAQLDTEITAFATRDLSGMAFPYVFADATYCKVRIDGRVVSQAVVVATGVSADGHREVLGHAVGDSEDEVFWTAFLRSLRDRGLHGVQLVISDAHRGLVNAIGVVCQGAAWQRCRVHFMRNALATVRKGDAEMVAAAIRTVFAQSTPTGVRAQVDEVVALLEPKFAAAAALLAAAKPDITAFADFPLPHWRKVWSTNPLERLNKEIKRRTDVVGIFPNRASLHRLSGAVLLEAHDEWQATDRRYLSEQSMAELAGQSAAVPAAALTQDSSGGPADRPARDGTGATPAATNPLVPA